MTGLHSSGAAICAIVDNIQPNNKNGYDMRESITLTHKKKTRNLFLLSNISIAYVCLRYFMDNSNVL